MRCSPSPSYSETEPPNSCPPRTLRAGAVLLNTDTRLIQHPRRLAARLLARPPSVRLFFYFPRPPAAETPAQRPRLMILGKRIFVHLQSDKRRCWSSSSGVVLVVVRIMSGVVLVRGGPRRRPGWSSSSGVVLVVVRGGPRRCRRRVLILRRVNALRQRQPYPSRSEMGAGPRRDREKSR